MASVDTKLLVVVDELNKVKQNLTKVEELASTVQQQVGPKGEKGDKGDKGDPGPAGKDGVDGKDGIDGKDGTDGKDGVSVVDASVDFDNSLVLKLSDGNIIDAGSILPESVKQEVVSYMTRGEIIPNQDGQTGKYLKTVDGKLEWATVTGGGGGGSGTVTSVAMTVPTGLSISGSPITTSGTLALTYSAGYSIPTTTKQGQWDTAYGWGNHASAGYLTSYTETDPVFTASPAAGITTTNISNWNTAYGWGNHASAGYLTSYTETDPIYTASSWYSTTNNSTNWNTAYGWGNHATAGYAADNAVVKLTGDQTIAGTKTFSSTISGSITGNAGTVTNGVYTNGSYADPTWITSLSGSKISGNITGNAANVTGTVAVANGGTGLTSISALSIPVANTANTYTTVTGTAGQSIRVNAGGTAWEAYTPSAGGGVTSVTATAPVASSGGSTPDISLNAAYGDTLNPYGSKTANHFLAAPNGAAGVPSFRAIVAADIPTLNQNTTGTASNVTGTVAVANGGTGQTSYTNGQLLIGNTTGNTLTKATLTAGDGVSITNGAGSITIASPLAESTSVFTSGTAQTYTAPANTQWVKVTVVGPGGNGGAANNQRATGGGGGAVAIKWLAMNAGQTLTYTVGTASGTASTVSSGTLTITTISAGSGANGAGTAYANSITAGPVGGTATGGDVNIAGERGGHSYGSGNTVGTNFSGKGGDAPGFGSGGPALGLVATAGVAGAGFGAGGGGAHGSNTAANGTGGIIIFEAY